MFTKKYTFVCFRGLMILILLLSGLSSISIAADMQGFPDDGLKNTKIEWFHTLHFYSNSKGVNELDAVKVQEYHKKIEEIFDSGKTPIGALDSWIFPGFANAPKVPGINTHMGLPVARLDSIPPFDNPDYRRLVEIRAEIYEKIMSEFPEIDTWLIGYEGDYVFKDLKGDDLDLDSYVVFILDTLKSSMQVIKKANPDADIVGHYLGRWGKLMKISGEPIQPRHILELVFSEIERRGEKNPIYFNQIITDLVPSLANDREEDIPNQEYGSRSYGWNTKWYDTFPLNTYDLTYTSAYWDDIRSSLTTMLEVVVASGKARCYLEDINGLVGAGAKTSSVVTVVPSAAQFDDNWSLKNYWTGYMEFDPLNRTSGDDSEHAGTFIRVNDRTWDSSPDQTRFGTIVYTEDMSASGLGNDGCTTEPCAALQFTGDSTGSGGISFLAYFDLSEQPFDDNSSTIWTLQIYERERLLIDYTYELEWKGEVVNGATIEGSSDWITSTTVLSASWTDPNPPNTTYYMDDIPELSGSKYLFGIVGNDNAEGEMDVDYTATAWWEW